MGKECIDVAHKFNQVGFTHAHLHLSLVDFSHVHHLVDEAENTFGIASNGLVYASS